MTRIWKARWKAFKGHFGEWGVVSWLTLWMAFGAWTTTLFPDRPFPVDAPDWIVSVVPGWALPYLPFVVAAIMIQIRQRKDGDHSGKTKNLGRLMRNAFNAGMGPVAALSHIVVIT